MINLLQQLEENCDIDKTWRLTIAADESGELLLNEDTIAIFDNKQELEIYVNALTETSRPLNVVKVCEILEGVQR